MGRRRIGNRNIRKLIRGSTSYLITVPIDFVRTLGWRDGQKLVVDIDERRQEITIRDWERRPIKRK